MKKVGTTIFAIGLLITLFTGLKFATKEKEVDVGKLHIERRENKLLVWSPMIGVVVMIIGGLIHIAGSRKV